MTAGKLMSRTITNCMVLWFIVIQVSSAEVEVKTLSRDKRNVLQLGNIIKKCTGRNALTYNGYGCYCGFRGRGKPVDAVDSLKQQLTNLSPSLNKSGCLRQACQCDIEFGRCLAGARYNRANKEFVDRS
ncbi:hypothetical protein Btru_037304, partial [Bulinus truncatus]